MIPRKKHIAPVVITIIYLPILLLLFYLVGNLVFGLPMEYVLVLYGIYVVITISLGTVLFFWFTKNKNS